jgi:hypothetical protein
MNWPESLADLEGIWGDVPETQEETVTLDGDFSLADLERIVAFLKTLPREISGE